MPTTKPSFPVLQRGHPQAQGLVGDWPLYEGSGLTANDVSGRDNTGTLTNGPTWSVGPYGNYLSFSSASSQYVDLGAGASLANLPPMTMGMWCLQSNQQNPILSKTDGSFGWFISSRNASTGVRFSVLPSAANMVVECAAGMDVGQWFFLAVTWDGTLTAANVGLYVNGVTQAHSLDTNGTGSVHDDSAYNLKIARGFIPSGVQAYGDVSTASLAVYSRVLSADEIAALYADSFARHRRRSSVRKVSGVTASEDQYGYRWRDDDGSEATATWLASDNTDVSRPVRTATRLRVGVNTTGDEPAQALKLQYRKVGALTWNDLA